MFIVILLIICHHGMVFGYITPDSYQYLNCYGDYYISGIKPERDDVKAIEECLSTCANRSYMFALISGNDCYCGDRLVSRSSYGCYARNVLRCSGNPY